MKWPSAYRAPVLTPASPRHSMTSRSTSWSFHNWTLLDLRCVTPRPSAVVRRASVCGQRPISFLRSPTRLSFRLFHSAVICASRDAVHYVTRSSCNHTLVSISSQPTAQCPNHISLRWWFDSTTPVSCSTLY